MSQYVGPCAETYLNFRPKEVYTSTEIAALLGMSPGATVRAMDSGAIPSRRIPGSRHRRTDHADLVKWLRNSPARQKTLERLEWAEKLMSRANSAVTLETTDGQS